ncbi:MAG TPA: histidine kinase [Draconibacterium sp.]|nr:histidine kinase [Draconibacterium sp.]
MNRFIFDSSLKFRIYRHVLFFLVTVLVFTSVLFIKNYTESFVNAFWIVLTNAVFFFCYAYITIFLLIPEILLTKKIGVFVLLFLLVGIALSALKLLVSDQIFYSAMSPENINRRGIFNLRFIIVNTKDMTFIVALFCIAKYIKDFFYAEKVREMVAVETKEAQRKLIQSQFDPHFLFNTINNLYAISLLDPSKTIKVISRIKIVLKYIIDEIQKELVDLKSEIELVRNYIQLEKMRYGSRLKVSLIVDENLHSHKIPPLILFYLIENSFKHGSSLDAGSPWINAEIKTGTDKIFLLVENSKPSNPVIAGQGEIQLKHLRKRLDIIYKPNGYNLKISNNENSYKVYVELNL